MYYGKVVLWHPTKQWWFVEYTDGDKETVHSQAALEDMLLYQCETPGCKFWSLRGVVERHEEERLEQQMWISKKEKETRVGEQQQKNRATARKVEPGRTKLHKTVIQRGGTGG